MVKTSYGEGVAVKSRVIYRKLWVVRGIVDAHRDRVAVALQLIVAVRHLAAEINIQLEINCVVLSRC